MGTTLDKKEGRLSGEIRVPIYYEDTDLSGFVYHSNYLKFFERAREELVGFNFLRNQMAKGIHFVVAKALIHYHAPARHGDVLKVKSECTFDLGPTQNYIQIAYLADQKLVTAEIKIATLNGDNRPIRLPDDVFDYL